MTWSLQQATRLLVFLDQPVATHGGDRGVYGNRYTKPSDTKESTQADIVHLPKHGTSKVMEHGGSKRRVSWLACHALAAMNYTWLWVFLLRYFYLGISTY